LSEMSNCFRPLMGIILFNIMLLYRLIQ